VPAFADDKLNQVIFERCCAPVVLGHWLVNKGGLQAVPRGRKPLRIPAVCVEHAFWLRATADHLDANGAVARALFDWLVNIGRRGFDEERAM
jgi:hypothetical protein